MPPKRAQLEAITRLITGSAEVEMVILYGSYARGDWVDDPIGGYHSDFDLLVIVKNDKLVDKHNLWSAIDHPRHIRTDAYIATASEDRRISKLPGTGRQREKRHGHSRFTANSCPRALGAIIVFPSR